MKHSFDSIIIGSGLGGLVTAVILAKAGKKVCVLEKNNQFGGNLQTFVRDKTIMDTGVHYIGGLDVGENLYQYFDYLGIMQDLKLKRLDQDGYDRISFAGQKVSYPHAQGYENFVVQLAVYFPEEREQLQAYCTKLQEICQAFPMYYLRKAKGYAEDVLNISLKSYLDELTDNELLKAVLIGSNFLYIAQAESTPLYVHALAVNSYMQSAWRCVKGGSQIAKLLIRELKKHGGKIYKHTEVTALHMDGSLIQACETKDHELFYAEEFISNINLKHTFEMLPAQFQTQPSVKRIYTLPLSPSVFSLYIVCKDQQIPYYNHNIYHYPDTASVWYTENASPLIISMSCKSEDQHYCSSMTIMCYMTFSEVNDWTATHNTSTIQDIQSRGVDYEAFKQKKTTEILQRLEDIFPNIHSAIRTVHSSSPLSYRDFIGAEDGNIYGFLKDANQPMQAMISTRTKVKNLFLTGQNVRMHGILGVTITAFTGCVGILGKDFEDQFLSEV